MSPQIDADIQEIVKDLRDGRPESPRHTFSQLTNHHRKPPTLKFNNSQLGVMRLGRLSDRSHPNSPIHSGQSHPSPSEPSLPCQASPLLTEFLSISPNSPSIGVSSLPPENTPEKKISVACIFCRGRKILCGSPLPGSIKKTCRSVYPLFFLQAKQNLFIQPMPQAGSSMPLSDRKSTGDEAGEEEQSRCSYRFDD